MIDDAYCHPKCIIDLPHPYAISPRKIVVDRNNMHALTRQSVQIGWQRGYERLTFARTHLGNITVVEDHAADELHIKMPLSEGTPRGFSHYRKCLWSQTFESRALCQALLKLRGLVLQLV